MQEASTLPEEVLSKVKSIVIPETQQADPTLKQIRLETIDVFSLPKAYRQTTPKERTLLDYAEDFRRQFVQLFPKRRDLLLTPLNECGTRKFISHFVHPSLLEFEKTYNLKDCARFLADFINYVPLENPRRFPAIIPSPQTVIRLREGDCMDMSVVLCSVLRGSGYRAHVVLGYATMWITMQDQTEIECPYLEETAWKEPNVNPPEEPDELEHEIKARYAVQRKEGHVSKYLQLLEQLEREKQEKRAREEMEQGIKVFRYEDKMNRERVHAWVLVRPGRRGIEDDLFVEPSTGQIFKVSQSPYERVEALFNEQNYWVNINDHSPISDLSFDLGNKMNWEFVLLKDIPDETVSPEDAELVSNSGEEGEEKEARAGEARNSSKDATTLLDPPAWTEPVTIDKLAYDRIYPNGSKFIYYKKCNIEKYSRQREGLEGLVQRVTVFEDDERQKIGEIREVFEDRKDLLVLRVNYPETKCIKYKYAAGKPSGIMSFVEVNGVPKEFYFYPGSRVDGMVHRTEFSGQKFIEEYQGTRDLLEYREVYVADPDSPIRRLKGFTVNFGAQREYPVTMIVEKFQRNLLKSADEDVRTRTHKIPEGQIQLEFHYDVDRITASSRLYKKDGSEALGWQADAGKAKPRPRFLRDEFHALVQQEKELMAKIRTREADFNEMISQIRSQLKEAVLEQTVYDKAREKAMTENIDAGNGDDIANDSLRSNTDYLSPFLAQFPAGKPLTKGQAEQARDECMASLTERLLERANIIQRRLNEENDKLKKREAAYQRSQGSNMEKDDEEFQQFYEQTMFRIHILEARLHRHEKMAMKKFKELDAKLRADPRLEIIHQ